MKNIRISGHFRLRSPLSHIGETISTTAYLSQEPILQPDGSIEEVFSYSGNAWRGQLRDCAAQYMLKRLGNPRLTLDAFHLLFSGGRIAGDQKYDVEKARSIRAMVPMLSVWGGGLGSQIMTGKLRVSNAYPVCREAIPVLPEKWHEVAATVEYGELTMEKSYSRRDDAKIDTFNAYLPESKPVLLTDDAPDLLAQVEKPKKAAKKAEKKEVADQMRMTTEVLIAGSTLLSRIDLLDATEIEIGSLVSAIHHWSMSPHIGGQASRGLGESDLTYEITDLDTGEVEPFLSVLDGQSLLHRPAEVAKGRYDEALRRTYDQFLSDNQSSVKGLLIA